MLRYLEIRCQIGVRTVTVFKGGLALGSGRLLAVWLMPESAASQPSGHLRKALSVHRADD